MTTACIHCGLPIPPVLRSRGEDFCCKGCARVYELIRGAGLARYYELRGATSAPASPLRPDSHAWLDRISPSGGPRADVPQRLGLDVQGIHCAACVWLLQALFRRHPGALDIRINPSMGRADLSWIPSRLDLRDYLSEVETFGYRFGPRRRQASSIGSGILVRLAICSVSAMNVMIFSIAFYGGLGTESPALYLLFGRISLALTALAVAVGGWVFFRSAIAGLRRGIIHLDLPIALGILLAFGGSIYAYSRNGPAGTYFDTVAAFVTLMLVGRWLQERVLERNRNSLLATEGVDHLNTRRAGGGAVDVIRAGEIRRGDEIWVVPGDIVPVQGTCLSDAARVSLDWITGESAPLDLTPGSDIPAGAFNAGTTTLRFAAEADFEESRLNDLLTPPSGMDSSRAAEPPAWSLWRRLGTPYVVAVLGLAAAGFLLHYPRGLEAAMRTTVSILVVTCPCALGLAIPLAHELTHVALRRRGVFVRNGSFLERALRVRKVIFDKTGTLTLGGLALDAGSRQKLAELPTGLRDVLYRMTLLSNHPASRVLTETLSADHHVTGRTGWEGPGIAEPPIEPGGEVREVAGMGLEWRSGSDLFRFGRPSFACERSSLTIPESAQSAFTRNGEVLVAFRFEEETKADVSEEIHALRAQGRSVFLLSGDAPEKVRATAGSLGFAEGTYEGGLTPEGKATRVRELDENDTLMVGDGINDALSFDEAFCTATPAVDRPALPARADFYYLGDGIGAVRLALGAPARLRAVVRANLAFALAYNALALTLCFSGWITPVVAAVLMPASSISVVLHTVWRLRGRKAAWTS